MQNEILNHLKNTYQPDAIILHGSRARSKEHEHSDWDFIFIYNQLTTVKNGRELYQQQNLEFSVHVSPSSDIYEQFGTKLQGAKVLYEKENEGASLLQQAADYYKLGVHWSETKIADHRLWVMGRISGMEYNSDNLIIFTKYFTDFYSRVFNYWYWVLQHKHSQPIYIATVEIAEKDPTCYELISVFTSLDTPPERKIQIAKEISAHIFKK